jgi:hypothetical protein
MLFHVPENITGFGLNKEVHRLVSGPNVVVGYISKFKIRGPL